MTRGRLFNKHNKTILQLILLSSLACLLMFVIEKFMMPSFFVKSLLRIIIFSGTIFLYSVTAKDRFELFRFKNIKKKEVIRVLGLAVLVYLLILVGFFLIKDFIDLNQIKQNLLTKEKITPQNFLFVSIYISLINSFLEEMFFRGFIFAKSIKFNQRKLGYYFSSILFSLYHVSIMDSWFSPILLVLLICGLFVVGVFFNYLLEKTKSFLSPWLIHSFANLAINTIGFRMLGLI